MLLRSPNLRRLAQPDLPALLALLDTDPVTHVYIASRVRGVGLDPWRLGAELWGWFEHGELVSACYYGANLIPVAATTDALRAFAEQARRQGRRCSSLVGPADQVLALWRLLAPLWGPAREVREDQPLLVTSTPPLVAPDPQVRPVRPDEVDILLPASVAMFTEEVGISPLADGGHGYRARVGELIELGRALARIEDGEVVFKAEIGSITPQAAQIQGVWVTPERRGAGLATAGMAAVVAHTLARTERVSLYANAYNERALRAYARVGFQQVGTFATVLF